MTRAPACTTLLEVARASVERFGRRPLFGERDARAWRWTSYAAWQARVDHVRGGMARLSIGRGDRVAIIARNGAAWATIAYASYGLGAATVPMYEAQRREEWEHILRDSGAAIAFVRTAALAAEVHAMQPRLPALRAIVTIEAPADDVTSLAAIEQAGRAHPIEPSAVRPDDLAGLVYTSGTTGLPKGVMLTHANLTTNAVAAVSTFPIDCHDRTVSFLPWAHVYGQLVELHLLIAAGASTAFNTDSHHLLEDLHEVRPTILVAVPRIFNRLHASVVAELETRPAAIRGLFWRGLAASIRLRRGEHVSAGDRIARALAGVLFAAVRGKLGGRLKYAISGSATLSRDVAEFIDGLGIEVYEGYGLTETSPIVTFTRPGHRRFGSVGLPISGVRLELDTSRGDAPGVGEIIVHGPNVMKGYYNRPDEDQRAFTADGGFRTGDLGRIDEDGYLYITGRIKEQYKLENGKYVMPAPLEEHLALSPFVTNVMLHGTGKPYNVALVAIDAEKIRGWAAEHGVELGADLTQDARVHALIREQLDALAAEFRSYERPRAYALTESAISVENGLLTPTLKLKRRDVMLRFGAELDALYGAPVPPPTAGPPAAAPPAAPR